VALAVPPNQRKTFLLGSTALCVVPTFLPPKIREATDRAVNTGRKITILCLILLKFTFMNKSLLYYLIALIVMNACESKEKADLIVHNAVVYTVDDDFSRKEAFAVRDGKFLEVGNNQDILDRYTAETTLDAAGKYIYPDFTTHIVTFTVSVRTC
jgi:hypothetical protein